MPSIVSKILRNQIRFLKPILSHMSVQADRATQDKLGELGARVLNAEVTYSPIHFPQFEAEMISPPKRVTSDVVLYLHGGGYTSGSVKYARGFGSVLSNRLSMDVLCPAYRLAPEHPFPAALEDAFSAYSYLLEQGYAGSQISLVGESAGGGLIFCLVRRLRELGMPMPARLVAISPWADLTLSGKSYSQREKKDPTLSLSQLQFYAEAYGGADLKNPLISPVFGDFAGFPPALIFVGTDEMLLDDAISLKKKYREAGQSCCLVVQEGLWHVYVLYAVPEAKTALERIDLFIKGEQNRE